MPAPSWRTTTIQTRASGAAVVNVTQAIDLLAGTTGGTVINNSGIIEGDVLFNAGGGGNIAECRQYRRGFRRYQRQRQRHHHHGPGHRRHQHALRLCLGVRPYRRIRDGRRRPSPKSALLNFGSGTGNELHVGGFGYVNDVIDAAPGGAGRPGR